MFNIVLWLLFFAEPFSIYVCLHFPCVRSIPIETNGIEFLDFFFRHTRLFPFNVPFKGFSILFDPASQLQNTQNDE